MLWKTDPNFPPSLLGIPDCPARIFWAGQPLNPKDNYFAIVGTRHPTPYGEQMAELFAKELVRAGFVIVSGLAYGIDAIAHQTALNSGGRTIAVLGSGLADITPPTNRPLAEKIKKSGTLISEYEPNTPAYKSHFPARNRIIAGMSVGTLVIEAPERSGALITARLAAEYGREVFAVPGNITQEASRGVNQFIRDNKAHPVTCVSDIFLQLGFNREFAEELPGITGATPEELEILKLLKKSSLSIDELIARSNRSAREIMSLLSLLQLKKRIRVAGGHVMMRSPGAV